MTDRSEEEQLTAFTTALEEVLAALLGPPAGQGTLEKRPARGRNKRRPVSKKKRPPRDSALQRGPAKQKRTTR